MAYALFLLTLFGALVGIPVAHAAMQSTSWYGGPLAGWVQAIGGILAVGAAAFISVGQAADQRRRDKEALRQRALDAVESRVQDLITAAKLCDWAAQKLDKALLNVGTMERRALAQALPLMALEFPILTQRMGAVSLHGQHVVVRENVIAAQGFFVVAQELLILAGTELLDDGLDQLVVKQTLTANLAKASGDIRGVMQTLLVGLRKIADSAAALRP